MGFVTYLNFDFEPWYVSLVLKQLELKLRKMKVVLSLYLIYLGIAWNYFV